MSNDWQYRAQLERVVDGDTIDLRVDLGFRTYKNIRVRLAGVDTAEIYGSKKGSDEYELGMEQTKFVEDFVSPNDTNGGWPLTFISHEESGKYGRWIGDIEANGDSLQEAIIDRWPEADTRNT